MNMISSGVYLSCNFGTGKTMAVLQLVNGVVREGSQRIRAIHDLAHREKLGQKDKKRASKTRTGRSKPGGTIQGSAATDQGGDAGNATANASNGNGGGGSGSGGGGGGGDGGSEGDSDGESDRGRRAAANAISKHPSRTSPTPSRVRRSSATLPPFPKALAAIPLPLFVLGTAILFAYTGHEDLAKTALLTLLGGRFMKPK